MRSTRTAGNPKRASDTTGEIQVSAPLHCVEGYSLKEAAAILHITENAVKKRLQRGKEALRQKLKDNTEVSI